MIYLPMFTSLALSFVSRSSGSPVSSSSNGNGCSAQSSTVVSDDNGIWPYHTYKTTNATAPKLQIESNGKPISNDSIFLAVLNDAETAPGVKQQRALIYSAQGELIWTGIEGDNDNFRVQQLNDQRVISMHTGAGGSHGYGPVKIFNDQYEEIYSVCPDIQVTFPPGGSSPCVADNHESYITENNTLLVTVYNLTRTDLTSVGGPADGWVYDCLAVEVDVKTNKTLWTWSALEHVPVNSTHAVLGDAGRNSSAAWDWFHMNSIAAIADRILINSRAAWSSYLVVPSDGSIEWELNGLTGGSFDNFPQEAHFSWQHHAQLLAYSDTQLLYTVFADNNADPSTHNISYGLSLILEYPPAAPQLSAHLIDSANEVSTFAQGSMQVLENGNYFVGYGVAPLMREFGNDSLSGEDMRWSAQFAYNKGLNYSANTYRAWKQAWHATPCHEPALVISQTAPANDALKSCADGSAKRGYISWDGATDVQSWTVYTGETAKSLQKSTTFPKHGFETEFVVPSSAKYVQVAAVQGGKEVRRSAVMAS